MSQVTVLLTLLAVHFGGWAVITLEDLPDQVVVGQPVTLTFAVRQHGRTLLNGLSPRVEAKGGGQTVRAAAAPATGTGRYAASLTLPNAGTWTITVYSGFGNGNVTLMPLPAVNPGRAASEPALATRGQRLFVAKGCLTCHVHEAVQGSGTVKVGPDLSGRRYASEYLQRFLADPSIATTRAVSGEEMPNLNLAPREIAALAAFINGERAQQAGE
ncbi:MAG TPA: c-type cytochrome [Gemmatimonadales bacterium]|jgi:mono/diheme cytochrome c family protein